MRIVVVGPCGSGKTTLVEALRELGYEARECVQEHSHVADMWRRISRPDVLIFLGISLESVQRELRPARCDRWPDSAGSAAQSAGVPRPA